MTARGEDPRAGWTCLAPGVYDDNAGGLHIDIAELLDAAGYADTPANRATLLAAARDVFGRDGVPISEIEE